MGYFDQLWTRSREVDTSQMATEETPLTHTTSENVRAAPEYLKRQASKLYELSKNGPLSFRVMAFLGGLGMIGAALYDFISNILVLSGSWNSDFNLHSCVWRWHLRFGRKGVFFPSIVATHNQVLLSRS
ncbi:hypothetical protein MHU86_84 [Fragilaria crotonensis]|nr:hypothetical protein MHU86_84 [Fragilaria crotonensis]